MEFVGFTCDMRCVVWLCRVRKGRVHVHDSATHAGCSITHDDYVWAEEEQQINEDLRWGIC